MLSGALDHLGSFTRGHALLLTSACVVLLLLSLPHRQSYWASFNGNNSNSARDEAEIDAALQRAADDATAQRDGVIVIMDAQTGRVRASVNGDRAYTEALMPGSTIKPFTTLAALRAGLVNQDSRTACPGRFTGLSFSLPCVHPDHLPAFTPSQAIAYSCNFYFATMGQRLGRDRLVETLKTFGFGQATGANHAETIGLVRPCETGGRALVRAEETNHAAPQADCTAREAIGESDHLGVTPIQLLTAYAALLNGGHLYQPQAAGAENFRAIERARINLSSQEYQIIKDGMEGAVRYGTARKSRLDALPLYVLGKTGTALPAKGFRSNGWFVGLAGPLQSARDAEPEDLKLAVLILLPRAHGAEAAALARPILAAYAHSQEQNDSQPTEKRVPGRISENRDAGATVKVRVVSTNVTREMLLEDYVLGVMNTEGTMETEPEALKALAVAIRTYAVKNLGRHAKDGYDFCSTTHCQRFGSSADPASQAIKAAVRATEGQILLDDHDQTVDSYFGASCGGETANIATLWGKHPLDYLHGVRDEFCVTGPHAEWTDVIKRADLLRALQSDARTDIGSRLDQIEVSKRDQTGRAEFITLAGEQHKSIRGWDFKIIVGRALGWNWLKSSRFEVSRAGSNFVFHGSGFGHGLGLCQEGAHVMAARGARYERILEKYFPGTRVERATAARSQLSASARNQTAEDAEDLAELAETSLGVPARNPPRSLRLNPLSHHAPSKRTITISSEHFRLTYPADVERREADQALNTLESTRSDLLRRAAAASIAAGFPTLEIRFNESTGDFAGRTGQPWWAAAATKGNRIELQPLPLLKRRGVLTTTLRHELAHVIINIISRDRAPRWLEEGFAIHLAGEGSMFSKYTARGLLSTDELERRLEHPRTQQEMRSLYAQAYLNVAELVRYQGEASVWKKAAAS
ncbi:MAG TPA: SpoIID/LytB domain-containing protein [Pyrinomonadaceae bacterium]|nr:SpoIID/LytB domain-containing protein [Pyrinomonadaceae bacterium]